VASGLQRRSLLVAGAAFAVPGWPAPDPHVTLTARPQRLTVAGRVAEFWTYDGMLPGPQLRLRPTEPFPLHFVNELPEATNLHFHGLHVAPGGRADNVSRVIGPGESGPYELTVPRGQGGLYWYHAHIHGRQATQLWRGLAGPLVVEHELDRSEALASLGDHVLLIKDVAVGDGGLPTHRRNDWARGMEGQLVLVNGAVQPDVGSHGRLPRLRLINACNARYLRLAVADSRPFHLIALDGHFLEAPVARRELLLVPGGRAELLVPLSPGERAGLMALPFNRGSVRSPSTPLRLLTLAGADDAPPATVPRELGPVRLLRERDVAVHRQVTMATSSMCGGFDPGRPTIEARVGDLELWDVVNVDIMDWPFQVLRRDSRPPPIRAWRDTINVRPGEHVELLVPLERFEGLSMYHCHIVEHGDRGMMASILVS
jgi:FtsP/CotA-like multicopper oxidase with cupredoxin domain